MLTAGLLFTDQILEEAFPVPSNKSNTVASSSHWSQDGLSDLSEILDLLDSIPVSQEQWQRFLVLLGELVQCKHGYFLTTSRQIHSSMNAYADVVFGDPELQATYDEQFADHDPFRNAIAVNSRTGVLDGEDLLPNAELLKTEIYRDLLEPRGLRHAILLVAPSDHGHFEALCLWRTSDSGPIDGHSRHRLDLLFPHILKALEVLQACRAADRQLARAQAMADASPTAMLLVSKRGSVIHTNAVAEVLLAAEDVLCLRDGNLVAAAAPAKERLKDLLTKMNRILAQTAPHAGSTLAIALESTSSDRICNLLAAPLAPELRERTGADAILLITDPAITVTVPEHVLHSIYGLTKAQSEVANSLLMGFSLEEIAEARGSTLGTVRQQIKAILNRTGTERQRNLVGLLLRVPRTPARE